MSSMDAPEHVVELCRQLDPRAFKARIHQFIKGGLPSRSMAEGSPSATKPEPRTDATDAKMQLALMEYGNCLKTAQEKWGDWGPVSRALERMRTLETGILVDRYMSKKAYEDYRTNQARTAAELKSPKARDCANPFCQRPVERSVQDRMLGGRCRKCYRYKMTNGVERPRELCERDIERELTGEIASTPRRSSVGCGS